MKHGFDTQRLTINLAEADDAADAIAYYRRNAAHLARWEPRREPVVVHDLAQHRAAIAHRRAVLAQRRAEAAADRGYSFFARTRDGKGERGGTIVASVNLSNVVRGVFQACHIGFSVDAAYEGKGVAAEAVGAVVRYAFTELKLHRVMANYQPVNERSGNLLRRLGFTVEGYARDYLYIDGAWRDHVLTALANPGWKPGD
jgi:ribosomal-protein-alanine N-acetyltransferase